MISTPHGFYEQIERLSHAANSRVTKGKFTNAKRSPRASRFHFRISEVAKFNRDCHLFVIDEAIGIGVNFQE